MRNKIPSLIALTCILIYAGAVLFGAYQVYTSIESRRAQAIQELDRMQNLISQNSSIFFTEPFREQFHKQLSECTALEGIIITGSQGPIYFEKEAGAVIRHDPNPRFIPQFGYITLQYEPMEIPGARNVNLYSVFNAVNYESLVYTLRLVLCAILGALLLSFITMMITMLWPQTSGFLDQTVFADETAPQESVFNNDYFDDDFSLHDSPAETADTESMDDVFELPDFDDFAASGKAESTADSFHLDDFLDEGELALPESEYPAEEPEEQSTVSNERQESQAGDDAGKENPNGLYSPRSNIGWEEYTQDRLASELHICASSEQDLIVLLMECGEKVDCSNSLYKKIAKEAVEMFNLRDLTFEYGNRGIAVIIPNAGLEQGISRAEAFHARLLKSFFDSFHSKNDFLIGISSRSGRLIEAGRLILEASRALEKAKTEPDSPIIAFKSDPEKYREYIKKA